MDRIRAMKVLLRTVERGSFAAASQDLGLSHGAASAIVKELEQYLGVTLLHRTTRSLRATDEGERYIARARLLLAELQELEEDTSGAGREPRGLLRVQLPAGMARLLVAPALAEFASLHPELRIEVISGAGVPDFQRDRLDAAVYIGELPDRDLIRVSLGRVPLMTVASPDYLDRCGTPETAPDLAAHDCIGILSGTTGQILDWRFCDRGRMFTQPITPRISFDGSDPAVAAAMQGAGILQMISFLVAAEIDRGKLVPMLTEWLYPGPDIALIHPRLSRKPQKLVAFERFLRGLLRDLGRDAGREAGRAG